MRVALYQSLDGFERHQLSVTTDNTDTHQARTVQSTFIYKAFFKKEIWYPGSINANEYNILSLIDSWFDWLTHGNGLHWGNEGVDCERHTWSVFMYVQTIQKRLVLAQ